MPLPKPALLKLQQHRSCPDKSSLCHAPSYSLYFGRNGNIQACCYSRDNVLGAYPQNSIQEVWQGAAIKQMQRSMKTDTLPKGCDLCATQIEADNYTGLLARNFDALSQAPWKQRLRRVQHSLSGREFIAWPKQMEFELSSTCNLECIMCSGFFSSSIRRNREQLAPLAEVYDSAFVEQLKPFIPHLKEAKFIGGEPFLIDIYYEIWELFIRYNPTCHITITTNGTVLNEKVKRVLSRLNCQIVASIDSLERETYERIRVNADYDRVMSNVRYFMDVNRQRNRKMSFSVCPMTLNWRELPAMIDFANREGVFLYFNTVVYPATLSLKASPSDDLAEINELLGACLENYRQTGDAAAHNRTALQGLYNQVGFWQNEKTVAEAGDLFAWCRKYLKGWAGKADSLKAALLEEIVEPTREASRLIQEEPDLISYFEALEAIGCRLQQDMPSLAFDFSKPKMQTLFDAFEQVEPKSAHAILEAVTKASVELVLRSVGTTTALVLLQTLQQYVNQSLHPA